jgi:hypothetical protein
MWERQGHFRLYLEQMREIYKTDQRIALHAADFCSTGAGALQSEMRSLPFPTVFFSLKREFCNGRGHNVCIQRIKESGALVAVTAVDLQMPADITRDIRAKAVRKRSFYGPMVHYQCKNGRVRKCTAAYALIAAALDDLKKVGKLQENMTWGGDRREGGEDTQLAKSLKKLGLAQKRPVHPGLVCRWHERNVNQKFYQSYWRYNGPPHWNLVDKQGNPVEAKRRKK